VAVVLLVLVVIKEEMSCVLACIYKKGPPVASGSITQLISLGFKFGCLERQVLFERQMAFTVHH
jgi:hypothetical protein